MRQRVWLAVVPLALVAIVALALFVLLSTTPGLRVAVRLAAPLVPGELDYEALEGRLIGPIEIRGLDYRRDDLRVTVARADIEWEPSRLVSRHLHFNSIATSGIEISLPVSTDEPAPEPGSFSLPELPLTVTAEKVEIGDLRLIRGETVTAVDAIRLAARLDGERYRIDSLAYESAPLTVAGNAELGLAEPYVVAADFRFDARVERDERTLTLGGDAQARGTTERLEFSLATDGALDAKLSGVATSLLDAAGVSARVEIAKVEAALAGFDTTGMRATFDAELDADSFTLDGQLEAPAFLPAPTRLQAAGNYTDELVRLASLQLRFDTLAATISATGTARRDTGALDLNLEWTAVQIPPVGDTFVASPRGRATVTGTPDAFTLRINALANLEGIPATELSLRGQGDTTRLEIEDFSARFEAAGTLSGRGQVAWTEVPTARLQLQGENIVLDRFVAGTEGRTSFRATLAARLPDTGPSIDVRLQELSGALRGKALQGRGRLHYSSAQIAVDALTLRAGDALLELNGRIAEQVDLVWTLDVPDLALLVPEARGRVRSKGVARGTRKRPAIEGELDAGDLRIGALAAQSVAGEFRAGIENSSPALVNLDVQALELGALSLGTVAVRSEGTVAEHELALSVDGASGVLRASARGGPAGSGWRGELLALQLSRPGYGDWTLAAPAAVEVAPQRVSLQRACLQRDGAGLCVEGDYARAAPWSGGFELDALPLAFLAPFLPPGIEYEGSLSGAGRVTSAPQGFSGATQIALSPGRLITRAEDEEDVLIGFEGGSIDIDFGTQMANARLHLDLRDTGVVDADLRVPLDAAAPLAGTVEARIENLSMLPALLPQVGRIDGRIEARLGVAGTRRAPELTGEVALAANTLSLPDLGIALQDARVDVGTRNNEVRFQGAARSGEGNVGLDGTLRFDAGKANGEIRLTGERFRAIDLPELWLDASPDLTIAITGREIRIEGEVTVPAARVTPIDIDTGISASSDQVIVGTDRPATDPDNWRINGRVRVTAGDAVTIKGFGLQGRLAGSVLIIDRPGQPTIGRGSLEVLDGEYRAYGQELTIETGRLEFPGGPIDDPGIDLRASRDTGEVVAGVQVRGALRQPQLDLYTVPPMSDSQAMSYLITGRGLEELDSAGQFEVNEAATKLALQGGSLLAASVGRGLGLDSLGFEDEGTTSSTSLVIGKHLSPRLFVSYGIGLFDAINTLRLRYQINPRLTFETESGARASADLLYSFER